MTSGRDSSPAASIDDEAMEEQLDTTMDQTQGTFIAGTAEPTVAVNGTRMS